MTEPLHLDLDPIFQAHPHARAILEALQRRGHEAVLVGGVVRDALRARFEPEFSFEPTEVDIATAAAPDQIQAAFPDWKVQEVGKAFGVTVLVRPQGPRYEIATFRQESDYDGRKPGRVSLIRSLEQDLVRRDFTVNALAVRLDGTVVDTVGGVFDLRRKLIRAIGQPDLRFAEDFLRMLRAVRFACALEAQVDPPTAQAIRAQARNVLNISGERIREELLKILATSQARRGVELLDELGLLEPLLPEVCALKGVPQPEKYHPEGDVFVHSLLALEWADRLSLPAISKLCVLVHDLGKPQALRDHQGEHMAGHEKISEFLAAGIGQRLRLSGAQIELLTFTAREHMRIARLPEMAPAKRMHLLKSTESAAGKSDAFSEKFPAFTTLLQVLICDAQASAHRCRTWLPVLREVVACALRLRDIQQQEQAHKLLDGNDLLGMNLAPGPQIGRILQAVYELVFAGKVRTRAEALQAARRLIEK